MFKTPLLSSIRPVKPKIKSIAVLTSGGDAPGMNAAIRAVVRYGISQGITVHGILRGYSGLLDGHMTAMSASSVANIIQRGGTILKTDRCEAFFKKSVRREAANLLSRNKIEGLVVIGGDGSFAGAHLLEKETGFPCIGVPGTIDNDIAGTELTIGFDTAVNTAVDAIDRIRDTASSHDRIFIVEVMGRSSGFIGLNTGIAGGAETILIPEVKTTNAEILDTIRRGISRGKSSSIIVVGEGDEPGQSSQRIASELKHAGFSGKACILGHIQRGGSPTAIDRVLASTLGTYAAAYLSHGKSGCMVGIKKNELKVTPFSQIIGKKVKLELGLYEMAKVLST